ncbi:hypothetical protein GOV04_04085 [Candidatus Woesearchaeota archaeon]|nr:hypothetical protein [Candidatus Woesearchaeota archaeon]
MSNRRSAIELSANIIVVIIIAMVVFGIGLKLVFQALDTGINIKNELDQQTRNEIVRQLTAGQEKVVVPFDTYKIDVGDSAVYGVGVLNVLNETEFKVELVFNKLIRPDKTTTASPNPLPTFFEIDARTLKKHERHIFTTAIGVARGTEPGTYVVDATVFYYDTVAGEFARYDDRVHKLFAVVE